MSGLRVGAVTEVDLETNSEIRVQFEISERFHDRVRSDSVVRAVRPFIIGEKVLDLSVGSDSAQAVKPRALIQSQMTADVMDLISGKTLAPYLETMGKMMENLRFVAEAILDPERSKAMVKIFDELSPLVQNASLISGEMVDVLHEVNNKKQLSRVINNLLAMTDELNKVLPVLTKDSPELAANLAVIAKNTAVLTTEIQKALPALQEIGPELPRASRRAIEALDETVVTLKALQKSFILRGSVDDVRHEEAARDSSRGSNRNPSSKEKNKK